MHIIFINTDSEDIDTTTVGDGQFHFYAIIGPQSNDHTGEIITKSC